MNKELSDLMKMDDSVFDFFQNGPLEGTWYWDLENPEKEWLSPRFWETLGYDPGEKANLAAGWQALVHPEDLGVALENIRKHCADPNHPYDQVLRFRHRDGSTVWMRCWGNAIRNERGEAIRMLGVYSDLTGQKKAEQALRENTVKYKSFYETVPLPYQSLNDLGCLLDVNPAWLNTLGYDKNQVIGKSFKAFLHPDSQDRFDQKFSEFRHSGHVHGVEFRLRHKAGHYLDVSCEGRASLNPDGRFLQAYLVIHDITERKKQESERDIMLNLLRSLNSRNDLQDLIREITVLMQTWSGCEAVGVRLREGKDYPYYETRGFPPEFVNAERQLCARDQLDRPVLDSHGNPVLECMCGNIICGRFDPKRPFFTENGSFWTNSTSDLLGSTSEADRQARTRNRCNGEGYESVALIPLSVGEQTLGLVQFNDRERDRFDSKKIAFLERLAANLSLGISQRLTQRALCESEDRYRAIFSQAADGILLIDPASGDLVEFNKKAHENLGYTDDEFRHLKISDIEIIESPEEVAKHTELVMARGFDVFETKHKAKDGRIMAVLVKSSAVTISGQQFVLSIFRDITAEKQAEKKLSAEKELIQRIAETSPAGITRVNANGVIVYANRRAEEILGLNKSEIFGRKYNEPGWRITDYHGKPFPEDKLAFPMVRETGRSVYNIRHAIEWPNGRRVLLTVNASPLINDKGAFDGMVATIEDITEKIRTEKDYHMLFHEMLDGFALHEMICNEEGKPVDYRFLAVNPAFERLTELKADRLIGKTVLEVLPNTEDYWIEKYGNVALTGIPMEFENYSQALDRHYHVSSFQPAPNQFACIFTDISERKKAEAALRESHERFLAVLDGLDASVYVADRITYEILFMNKAMVEAFGRDLTGEICWKALRGQDNPCHHCSSQHLMDENGRPKPAYEWQDKSRITGRWYMNRDRAIKWTDGRMAHLQVATDITEMKEMESRLKQAQKMEAIGNLAGGIAHDFNNILCPIVGLSEMLMEDVSPSSLEYENAAEIFRAGKRGGDLVKQILAFSRQSEHKKMPIRIQQVLKEVLKLSRSTIPVDIPIHRDIQQDCRIVMADPTQIHQIAMNLITNAYHAVESMRGEIHVRLKEVDIHPDETTDRGLLPGRYAQLSVTDTGMGIEPGIMDKIFEPYFTTKARGKGTGLGLSVVYGIVKEHLGDIKVRSRLGEGTIFDVFLPVLAKAEEMSPAEGESAPPVGHERILLVDDEETIAKLEKLMLERLGYNVTMRVNSLEALEVFKCRCDAFDLVISDMTMPNMTGDHLARELIALRPDIPIVICTGFSERLDPEKASSIGIKGFLMKPIIKAEMAKMIRQVLDEAKFKEKQSQAWDPPGIDQ